MTFNTTCLCVFGSVNSFPVDSPCLYPKYHPAEPFRQLLSIDWLGGWNDRSTSYAYVQILIIISTFYRRSFFFFFFLPFQFLFIFPSFSRIYVCLWFPCSRRSSEARIGGTRKLKLEINIFERRNFVFSKNSRLKSQGKKNSAMSRRRRRRTLRRCRPRDFSSRAIDYVIKRIEVTGRVALGAGSRAQKSTGVPRPQASVARHLLRHVLCDANFSPRTSPPYRFFSLARKSNNDLEKSLTF